MKVLLKNTCNEIIIKNSRFIAEAIIISSQQDAREKLHQQKERYSDATHVCHAFVCGKSGETNGMSDDGEPSGTAGRPMLDVLKGSGITNILVTVTRYFGGTLLGTGGLVHAYSDSVKEVLAVCETEELVEKSIFTFNTDYSSYNDIKHIFPEYHLSGLEEEYTADVCCTGEIWASESQDFAGRIKNLTKGKTEAEITSL